MKILYRFGLVILAFFSIVLMLAVFTLFGMIALPWYILKGNLTFPIKVVNTCMKFLDKIGNKFNKNE